MEGSLNERIKETLLECRICLSTLTKPKSLPHCLHTFCEKCLINYVVHQLEPFSVDVIFPCPICRHDVEFGPIDNEEEDISETHIRKYVMALPNAFFAVSLADLITADDTDKEKRSIKSNECGVCKYRDELSDTIVQAEASCVECKLKLCDQCVLTHHQLDITKHHTLLHDSNNNNDNNSQTDWLNILDTSMNSTDELCFKFCNLCEEEIFAMTHCEQCEVNMCGNCSLMHAESFSSIDHTLSRIERRSSDHEKSSTAAGSGGSQPKESTPLVLNNVCETHSDETVAYYCVTCSQKLCIACLLCEHQAHDTLTLGKAFQVLDEELQPIVDRTRDVLYKISEENEHLMAVEQQLELEKTSIIGSIQRQYQDELKRLLNHRDDVLNRVQAFYDTREVRERQSTVDACIETLLAAGDYYLNDEPDRTAKRSLAELQRGMHAVRDLKLSLEVMQRGGVATSCFADRLKSKMYFTPAPVLEHQRIGGLYIASNQSHRIVPVLRSSALAALRSPYNSLKVDVEVVAVGLTADDTVLLVRTSVRDEPCLRVYSRSGRLKRVLTTSGGAAGGSTPVAMAIRRCGRQVAVLNSRSGDICCVDIGTGQCTMSFSASCCDEDGGDDTTSSLTSSEGGGDSGGGGAVDIAVDCYDRCLVLDADRRQVLVHSHTDGHHIDTLTVSEVRRPHRLDVCSSRLCVLDADTTDITIYRYTDNTVEFIARLDSSVTQFLHGITAMSSDYNNGDHYITDSDRLLRLTTSGRANKVTGIGAGTRGIQRIAVCGNEIAVCRRFDAGISEDGETGCEQSKTAWEIYRFRLIQE